ncbi:MAG: Fic family protein [Proteobacteria bacterium]|nr:Fic family protein [Pseudomonadota bacterium]MBU1696546.1 Fic family protein [Pseudomonadota bacterium]
MKIIDNISLEMNLERARVSALDNFKPTYNRAKSRNIFYCYIAQYCVFFLKRNSICRISNYPLPAPVLFVFRFLAIHPFTDGNGRLGRALFILALLQNGYEHWKSLVPFIAIDRHIEQNRPLYYSVLHKCSEGKFHQNPEKYEIEPLIWFFVKIIGSALDDIPVYRKRFVNSQKLSETALNVLNCFKEKPENRLNVGYIIKTTGIPSRTIQYALKTLVEKEFLQRLGQGRGTRYQLVF